MSANYKLCGNTQTLLHVLAGCKTMLEQGRYTWRHNCVLNHLETYIRGLTNNANIISDLPGTVVPALGDPRRERPPAVYGHLVNVPTHFNVKLPVISSHLPNADADSHLLVVSTCNNGQCKQMPRFRWSFQPKIAWAHPNLRLSVLSNFRAVVW